MTDAQQERVTCPTPLDRCWISSLKSDYRLSESSDIKKFRSFYVCAPWDFTLNAVALVLSYLHEAV